MKFLCDQCKAKYQIADDKVAGKTVRMKCRKCGHVIEIRAAVTESSSATERPAPPPAANSPLAARRPPPAAPAPRRDALSTAMQKNIASAEAEASAGDPTAPDEWYVAINGVPVGPIGISELRRKAASGSVTDASLVWREGLEEWRPLRTISELAALVRDAGGGSMAPRAPSRPAPPPRASLRAPAPQPGPAYGGPSSMRAPTPPPRSNVIPLRSDRPAASMNMGGAAAAVSAAPDPFATSPLPPVADPFSAFQTPPPAQYPTHERMPEPTPMASAASYAADPFAMPAARHSQDLGRASLASILVPPKKPFPWGPVSMLAAAIAFGVTAGVVFFLKKDQPQIVIQTVPGPVQTVVADRGIPAPTAVDTATPAPTTSGGRTSTGPIAVGGPRPSATASGGAANLKDLGLGPSSGGGPSGPGGGTTGGGSGPGGSLSESDVQRTVSSYTPGVKRKCWDTAPPGTSSVNVLASITVGGDGSVQNVSANGSDTTVAKCIEGSIRNWHFPATGGKSTVNVPFKFVRQ